jgi:hypothetical protein
VTEPPGWTEAGLRRLAGEVYPAQVPAQRSGCCEESGCRRKQPIGIYRGDFTGLVYAATSMRVVSDHGDGTATFAATTRHDITRQMRRFIMANAEWVREVLEGQP